MSIEITPTASLPKHIVFEAIVGTVKIMAIHRTDYNRPNMMWAKSKAYDVANVFAPELVVLEPFTDYSIPFKPVDADDKVRASMWSAWKRETMKIAAQRLQEFLDLLELECDAISTSFDAPHRFSFKAGCSCGCSPAFILGGHFKVDGQVYPVDIYFEAVVPKKDEMIAEIEELLKPMN